MDLARAVILTGVCIVIVGLVLLVMPKLPFLGKLPGDILIKRENFTLYFPLTTSIVISIVASIVLYLISKFK